MPSLPPHKINIANNMQSGSIIKYVVAYPAPFWREKGLSGEMMSDIFPLHFTFDNCNEDCSFSALVAFSVGDNALLLHKKSQEVSILCVL